MFQSKISKISITNYSLPFYFYFMLFYFFIVRDNFFFNLDEKLFTHKKYLDDDLLQQQIKVSLIKIHFFTFSKSSSYNKSKSIVEFAGKKSLLVYSKFISL